MLDAVVAACKALVVDEFLVDRHSIAAEAHLRLDPVTVGLTGRAGGGGEPTPGLGAHRRWPGWGNLTPGAGGHGGIWPRVGDECRAHGVCEFADRLAIDAGLSGDFVLRHLTFQERQHRVFLLWLQDIHLRYPHPSQSRKGR
ncbi:MAG: hypothetical protein ACYDHY_16410 [Acidiferrobacterales bacterium]